MLSVVVKLTVILELLTYLGQVEFLDDASLLVKDNSIQMRLELRMFVPFYRIYTYNYVL